MSTGYLHVIFRSEVDKEPTEVDRFVIDHHAYNLVGEDNRLIAETYMNDRAKTVGLPAGQYTLVITSLFQGDHVLTLHRPLPLPEKWTRLSTWNAELTGRPSKFFALALMDAYPGTDVEIMGEHVEDFAAHYERQISLTELTERTGYILPDGTPEPVSHYCTNSNE